MSRSKSFQERLHSNTSICALHQAQQTCEATRLPSSPLSAISHPITPSPKLYFLCQPHLSPLAYAKASSSPIARSYNPIAQSNPIHPSLELGQTSALFIRYFHLIPIARDRRPVHMSVSPSHVTAEPSAATLPKSGGAYLLAAMGLVGRRRL